MRLCSFLRDYHKKFTVSNPGNPQGKSTGYNQDGSGYEHSFLKNFCGRLGIADAVVFVDDDFTVYFVPGHESILASRINGCMAFHIVCWGDCRGWGEYKSDGGSCQYCNKELKRALCACGHDRMAHDKGEGWIGHSIPCTKCDCQKFDRQYNSQDSGPESLSKNIPGNFFENLGQESLSENLSGENFGRLLCESRIPGRVPFSEISPKNTWGGDSITPRYGNPKSKNTVSTPGPVTKPQST